MSQKKSKHHKKQSHPHPAEHSGQQHTGNNMHISGNVEISRSPNLEEQHKTERAEDSAHENKKYRMEMLTLAAVIVYAFLTLLIYCASKKAADAAKSAADTAAKQLELTERPWVKVDLQVAGPLLIDKNGMNIIIQAVTKATGNSPATSVAMESKMYVGNSWPASLINDKRYALCEDLKKRAGVNQKYLKSLFSGTQEPPEYQHLGITRLELDEALKGEPSGRILPLIVTCVVYRSTFNDNFYETAHTSMVMAIEQGMGMSVPGTKEIIIPADRLDISTDTYVD